MNHGNYRAAPLSIPGLGRRGRKLGAAGTVGKTHKQLSQQRGSVRAETSDAAEPVGSRVCRGSCSSHPQQHPLRPSPPPRGGSGAACQQLPRARLRGATLRKFALQRPRLEAFGVPWARAPTGEWPGALGTTALDRRRAGGMRVSADLLLLLLSLVPSVLPK